MDTVDTSPDELTVAQAAELLGKTTKTIRRYIKNGQLPRRYVSTIHGAQLIIPRQEVERLRGVEDDESSTLPFGLTTGHDHGQEGAISTLSNTGEALQELVQGYQLLVQGYQQALERVGEAAQRQNERVHALEHEVRGLRTALERSAAAQSAMVGELQGLRALAGMAEETRDEMRLLRETVEQRRPWWKFWA